MNRSQLATSVLAAMLIACSSAAAGGVNLAWTNCGSEGGTANRSSACLVNTGSNALVGSFVLNTDQAGTFAGSNFATWQGVGPSCALVPTKRATWGLVKSLYH